MARERGFGEYKQNPPKKYKEGYEAFERIPEEKRRAVLAAALREFASNSYHKASTNEIVKKAGISKGLLFHYFTDKVGLYRYLAEDTVEYFYAEMKMDEGDYFSAGDIFDVLIRVMRKKNEVALAHKLESAFFIHMARDEMPAELRELVAAQMRTSSGIRQIIEHNLDRKLLKDGIDRERCIKLIDLVCVGLTEDALELIDTEASDHNFNKITDSVVEYLSFLRELLYR